MCSSTPPSQPPLYRPLNTAQLTLTVGFRHTAVTESENSGAGWSRLLSWEGPEGKGLFKAVKGDSDKVRIFHPGWYNSTSSSQLIKLFNIYSVPTWAAQVAQR